MRSGFSLRPQAPRGKDYPLAQPLLALSPLQSTLTCLPFMRRYHGGPGESLRGPPHTCANTREHTETSKKTEGTYSRTDTGDTSGHTGVSTQAPGSNGAVQRQVHRNVNILETQTRAMASLRVTCSRGDAFGSARVPGWCLGLQSRGSGRRGNSPLNSLAGFIWTLRL